MFDWLISWGRRKLAEEKEDSQPLNQCTDVEVSALHKPPTQDQAVSKTPVVACVRESREQSRLRCEQNSNLVTFRSDRGRLG
jgi:hypothetical protein